MRVVIAGGGIAGLALAIGLQRRDVDVVLVEQADAFSEVGAGIWLTANAVKALEHLGVDVTRRSVPTRLLTYGDYATDESLYSTNLALAEQRYGAKAHFVHRADLLAELVAAVDPTSVRVASRVVAVEQAPGQASVVLADGSRVIGDAVVGADGLRSTVRAALFGESEPEFSGIVAWRSIMPFERVAGLGLEPACQHLWLGARRTTVSYPLRQNELYNFVGLVPAEEVAAESWTQSGSLDGLRSSFAGACERLTGVVEAIDSAFVTGLYYRPPLPEWSVGRVGLLGDAAHPALPTAGQGAAMGLEDAVILADGLARHGAAGVADALTAFGARRRARTGRVLGLSRANALMLSFDTPALSRARNGRWRGMRALDPDGLDFWQWGWSYDVDAVIASAARPDGERDAGAHAPASSQWSGVLEPADRALGWAGERRGYARFWERETPLDPAVELQEVRGDGVGGLRIGRAGAREVPVVLHLHGGGFTMGSPRASAPLADRLARAVDGVAFNPAYRLAPEFAFPAAAEDVEAACRRLIGEVGAENVVLSGEGAGAGLALAAAIALRDVGEPLPRALHLVSPLCDLALGGESVDQAPGADDWHNRETLSLISASYLQGADPRDPRASPLYADLRGLPAMLIQAGACEALADDARRLARRAEACGVDVRLTLYDTAVHSFVLFPSLVESRRATDELRAWWARQTCAENL